MSVPDVITAFSAEHVKQITGFSHWQLANWDLTGFFAPQYESFGEGRDTLRVYSFRDVVGLKTISILRSVHKVSMQHLRKVARRLSEYSPAPFASLKLTVCNREVHFMDPDTGKMRGVISGQYAMLAILDVMNDVKKAALDLSKRDDSQIGHTERRRSISHNKIVIAGTRIPVRAIEHFIEDGFSTEDILRNYPILSPEDVEAVRRRVTGPMAA